MQSQLQIDLDSLAADLHRSVSLDDESGHLVAYSAQSPDIDRVRTSAILTRTVPADVRAWQQANGVDTARGPVTLPANPDLGMTARTCMPIHDGRTRLGSLWIIHTGAEPDDIDHRILIKAADRIAALLRAERDDGPSHRSADDLFHLLGRPQPVDPVDTCHRLRECLRAGPDRRFVIATAALAATGGHAQPDLRGDVADVRAAIRRRCPASAIAVQSRTITLLLPPDRVERFADATVTALARWTPTGYTLVVGVSAPTTITADAVAAAFYRSRAAADAAAIEPTKTSVLIWPELAGYQHLLPADRRPDPTRRLSPLLDAEPRADILLQTLETYFDNAGDAQRTAAELHLHRTSLYYRLRRISELLAADLTDGRTRTDLHIAIKQMRVNRSRHPWHPDTF